MIGCWRCEYFQNNRWKMTVPLPKRLFHVVGFCMYSDNPDFNDFAKEYGRGIGRVDSFIKPKWCNKKSL